MISILRRTFSAALAVVLPIAAFAAGGEKPVRTPASPPRSLWVWNTESIRAGGVAQKGFFTFLAAPHGKSANAIHTVYFDGLDRRKFADPAIVEGVRRFLREAHRRHLRVDFLTGDPHWAMASGQAEALSTLDAVLAFNRGGKPEERYDGFQYDVEPYSLPDWPSPTLRQGLLNLLDKSNARIRASGQKVILSAAIPRWFDQAQFDFLDQKIIDRADEIVIMDYVHTPEALVADASGELAYAAKVGKKVWIGVETLELKDTPQSSFFGRGNTALEEVLTAAAPQLHPYRSFAGYAIHHWDSYMTLKP